MRARRAFERPARHVHLSRVERQSRDLHVVPRLVVVPVLRLLTTVRAFDEPREVRPHPGLEPVLVGLRPRRRGGDEQDTVEQLGEVPRLDDADAAALVDARDVLAELQVRVHPRRGIEEPRAHEPGGVRRILLSSRAGIRQRQRRDRVSEPSEIVAVGDPVDLWIALAVLADVRLAIRLRRIRPPVRRLAHVVVLVAAGRRDRLVHHGHRRDGERLLRVLVERRDRGLDRRVALLAARTHVAHVRPVEQQRRRSRRLESARRAARHRCEPDDSYDASCRPHESTGIAVILLRRVHVAASTSAPAGGRRRWRARCSPVSSWPWTTW